MKSVFLKISFGLFAVAAVLCGVSCSGMNPADTSSNSARNSNTVLPVIEDSKPKEKAVDAARVEEALKKEGFSKITIDLTTSPPTLRGTVPKDKLAIAILVAERAAGTKLGNGLVEK
jgi:hypothetical protein